MASLTEVSIISRKIIRYSIYAIILIIIAKFSLKIGVAVYKKLFPPPLPKPTVAFGKLPKLPFPDKPTPENLKFTLELAQGKLPTFTDQAEVYFMPPPQTNIGVLDEAKARASSLGFSREGKILAETIPNVYVFPKPNQPSNLTMNIVTQVFSVSYNIDEDPSVISGLPPDIEPAISLFRNYLAGARFLQDDLREGPATTQFLRIEGGKFVPALSLSEADVIKVNLFRKGYGQKNYPSVTPEMPEANIWAIIAGAKNQIIAAEYHYFPIDSKKSATYPLKTSEQAWEELKQGKGYIANVGNNPDGKIIIRKVYLAYYDAGQYTQYYQPVIVFEGDNDFYAYVPAVANNFYGAEAPKDAQ